MRDNRIPPQTRPMTEAEILHRRKLRRAAIKKQQRRRTIFLTACGLAAVLLIAGIVLLCRGCGRSEGTHNESIYGSFAMSDKSCVYTFREDGSGELRLSGAPYRFRFTLSGKTLSIDFDAEALADCEYDVAYTDTGLELTAGKGTTTQGEKYILNRTEK